MLYLPRLLGLNGIVQSGRGKVGGGARRFRSIPGSPGHPGRSAEGAIPQEITSEGLAATRPELGDGGAVPAPPPQAGGSPSNRLPPPSPLSQSLSCRSVPGDLAWSPSLLRPTFALPQSGDALSCPLGGCWPCPPNPCRGPRLFSWGTLRRG